MTIAQLADRIGIDIETLRSFGVRDGENGAIVIPYFNADNTERERHRLRHDRDPRFTWSPGSEPLAVYGRNRPVPVARGFVWVVEGESDCWALWANGIPAIGIPGASSAATLELADVDGCTTVAVVQEPGEAGARFPTRVANRLYDAGFTGDVYAVTLPAKDPRELLLDLGSENFHTGLAKAYAARRLLARPQPQVNGKVVTPKPAVMTIGAFFERYQNEAIDWAIEGRVSKGGIWLLAGYPKTGKTTLIRSYAMHASRGTPWLGMPTKKGRVLILALEGNLADYAHDLARIGIAPDDDVLIFGDSFGENGTSWLRETVIENKIDYVVIDTLQRFLRVSEGDAYGITSNLLDPLIALGRETGVTQAWLTHTRKPNRERPDAEPTLHDVMGSTAFAGTVDTCMLLWKKRDGNRYIKSEQRKGSDLEARQVVMHEQSGEVTLGTTQEAVAHARTVAAVEKASLTLPSFDRDSLIKSAGVRRADGIVAFATLVANGVIMIESGSGRRGDPIMYVHSDRGLTGTGGAVARNQPSVSSSGGSILNKEQGTGNIARVQPSGTARNLTELAELREQKEQRERETIEPCGLPDAHDEDPGDHVTRGRKWA